MSLKKIKIIGVFIIFALTFLFHYLYEWLPNPVFAVLFPVNESIWEHMKLIYSGFLFWGIIEYFLIKKYDIKVSNFISSLFITMIVSVIVYLILYLPLYDIFGESMIMAISLLFLVIVLGTIFNYYLETTMKDNNPLSAAVFALVVLGYVVFASLTYNPIKNYIFYDTHHHKYGVNIYEKAPES